MKKQRRRKALTDNQIDALVVADAKDPSAWGDPVVVKPSKSKRPEWMAVAKQLSAQCTVSNDSESLTVQSNSSVIASLNYHPGTETLQIQFRSGRVYQYFDVPSTVFEALKAANSVSTYFKRQIQDRYPSRKVA